MEYLLLLIATSLPHTIHTAQQQTKNTFTYINNDTYWRSLTPFTPINNASYGSIRLGRSVHMEFSFIYHSRNPFSHNSSIYENVFRIGYGHSTNNALGAGSRYPSMWIYYKQDLYPHIEFSISDSASNWRKYPPISSNSLSIKKEQKYKCIVDFNETYVSIDLSTHKLYQVTRPAGTATNIIDSEMYVWIAQFGHDGKASPVANITMFDMEIATFDHPTSHPTLSPIVSVISDSPIELYEFYDEPLIEYKNKKIGLYKEFIFNAIIEALKNITGYSMNMADYELYIDKPWHYGGIDDINGNGIQFCMIFNKKLIDKMYIDCPLIPNPYSNEFEYVSVGLLYVESDINANQYREYIMDIMDLDKFHQLFRKYLIKYVNDDQQLFIITDNNNHNNGYLNNDLMNKIKIIGITVIVTCITICIIMIGYYSKKWYKMEEIKYENNEKISENNNNNNDNNEMETDENILNIYRKVTISRRNKAPDNTLLEWNSI